MLLLLLLLLLMLHLLLLRVGADDGGEDVVLEWGDCSGEGRTDSIVIAAMQWIAIVKTITTTASDDDANA